MISTEMSHHAVMDRKTRDQRLGRILIDRNIINKNQLDHALSLQVENKNCDYCGEIMMRLGYITEKHVTEVLACQYRLPYISLENYKINKKVLDLVPFSFAVKYLSIPLDRIGSWITVAMANPQNYEIVRELSIYTGYRVCVLLSTTSEIRAAIKVNYEQAINEHRAKLTEKYSFRCNR